MAKSLISPIGRVSHPHVFEVNEFEGRRTFNITLLIPKGDKWVEGLRKAMDDAAKADPKFKGKIPSGFKYPVKDGDVEAEEKDKPEYKGHWLVKFVSSEDRRPGVVDASMQPITDRSKFYAGCYARVSYGIYPYIHSSGTKGVRLSLNNCQFCKDGERFGGGSSADEDFEALEEAATGDDDLFS